MPAAKNPLPGLLDTMGRRNRKLADKTCPHCGGSFKPHRAASRYCSRPCQWANNRPGNIKGESWWVNAKGYICGRIWTAQGPRNVRKHRFIMECHLGRKLLPGEDVHHINGDRQDNRLENLELLSASEHALLHNREKRAKRAAINAATGGQQ
jgi:hypothetical protein